MTNTEHLHQEGVINKVDISEEQTKALDNLSKEEVEQIKAIHKNANKDGDQPVGICL